MRGSPEFEMAMVTIKRTSAQPHWPLRACLTESLMLRLGPLGNKHVRLLNLLLGHSPFERIKNGRGRRIVLGTGEPVPHACGDHVLLHAAAVFVHACEPDMRCRHSLVGSAAMRLTWPSTCLRHH
jgi:hypothetical protein